ncbi:1-acyl-sn-glycerol-3-phosphate acyltransferase [Rhodovastum atsumiense]|uniref:1-acyl-sn-glycerol-3-phosphate acyltransferase n=1 Tax=Rhodovastum atsumiense TaxID=504468 RepID=A0A5M6IZK5_9PROT|nr:lysophospholipid acyltransferase family protein [Rhodovastum atsumiense]KAA5613267.1 1-acyl-sn-glycerol-3-phosphate acyltransferase [Rhodovastum atsumiense]CAH2600570.1 1-acyl-sn-glycerol-3-phosphate acyltransferase [Rhodovastum atsumiense]
MILLRSLVFNIWFYGLTTVICLWYGLFGRDPGRARDAARLWARLVLGGLRRICGIDWEVSGREHLASGPVVIAPMHQSAFDAIVWVLLVPEFVYVLKRELTLIPLFGALLLRAGMIPVDRRAGATALRDVMRRAERATAAGQRIVIFPEGTRVAPGVRAKLQPGVAAVAARTGLPVIPVVTDSGHYWGRRAFLKRPGTIRLAIMPPLPAGLPREAVMTRLSDAYATGYAELRGGTPVDKFGNGGKPVDNSVGFAGSFRIKN